MLVTGRRSSKSQRPFSSSLVYLNFLRVTFLRWNRKLNKLVAAFPFGSSIGCGLFKCQAWWAFWFILDCYPHELLVTWIFVVEAVNQPAHWNRFALISMITLLVILVHWFCKENFLCCFRGDGRQFIVLVLSLIVDYAGHVVQLRACVWRQYAKTMTASWVIRFISTCWQVSFL